MFKLENITKGIKELDFFGNIEFNCVNVRT